MLSHMPFACCSQAPFTRARLPLLVFCRSYCRFTIDPFLNTVSFFCRLNLQSCRAVILSWRTSDGCTLVSQTFVTVSHQKRHIVASLAVMRLAGSATAKSLINVFGRCGVGMLKRERSRESSSTSEGAACQNRALSTPGHIALLIGPHVWGAYLNVSISSGCDRADINSNKFRPAHNARAITPALHTSAGNAKGKPKLISGAR